jgi:hypothetical protein
MPYQPIRTATDLAERLRVGITVEDHHLEFKGLDQKGRPYSDDDKGKNELRRDVLQFANASGGTIVYGAIENVEHVLCAFTSVAKPQQFVERLDQIVKAKIEPTPSVEPYVLPGPTGEELVVVNVPPMIRLVGLRVNGSYEFPIRAASSKRYLTLAEIEARMQDRDRMHRLRLEAIGPDDAVGLDGPMDRDLGHNDWRVVRVDDDVVTLSQFGGVDAFVMPLVYIAAVYRADETDAKWVIALSAWVSKNYQNRKVVVTKEMPYGRNQGHYRTRGLNP